MRKHSVQWFAAAAAILAAAVTLGRAAADPAANMDWPVYRGDPKGNQYVPLAQIHAANVHRLQPAWEYRTGDANERSTMHVNPIVVSGVMYVTTPSLKAVALDAATGKEIWVFDPAKYNNGNIVRLRNRGVTYWKGAEGERIFQTIGTIGNIRGLSRVTAPPYQTQAPPDTVVRTLTMADASGVGARRMCRPSLTLPR